jgi:hypothetical protein
MAPTGIGGCMPTCCGPGTTQTMRQSGLIMRELDLEPCQPKPFRPITTIAGDAGSTPDLVNRDFTADTPGVKLVGDITY